MAKAQIVVSVDEAEEVRIVTEWFDRWRDRLISISANSGCGCCVDIWNVEGPEEALRELPDAVIAYPGLSVDV